MDRFGGPPFLVLMFSLLVVCACGEKDDGRGHWGDWSEWSACSATCGSGTKEMRRQWIRGPSDPKTKKTYTSTQIYGCVNKAVPFCPVNGTWSGWAGWTQCTKGCGKGSRSRVRDCLGRYYNGEDCHGEKKETMACNKTPCPVLPRNFQMSQCSEKNFTCTSKKMCVESKQKCDETVQCHDGSDEMGCPRYSNTGRIRYDLGIGGTASAISASPVIYSLTLIASLTMMISALRVVTMAESRWGQEVQRPM